MVSHSVKETQLCFDSFNASDSQIYRKTSGAWHPASRQVAETENKILQRSFNIF